jgi:hypothetical protein
MKFSNVTRQDVPDVMDHALRRLRRRHSATGSGSWFALAACKALHCANGFFIEVNRAIKDPLAMFRAFVVVTSNPRNLQEICKSVLGILALLTLSASFRICKLQILLAARETDPVSGHHLESIT